MSLLGLPLAVCLLQAWPNVPASTHHLLYKTWSHAAHERDSVWISRKGSSLRVWLGIRTASQGKQSWHQACRSSGSGWTMLSAVSCDFWALLCKARSWTWWLLQVPSNSGYYSIHNNGKYKYSTPNKITFTRSHFQLASQSKQPLKRPTFPPQNISIFVRSNFSIATDFCWSVR